MIEIRSYRRVFALERRIYAVDRLRLNPSGIPVRSVSYVGALLLALVVFGRLPVLGRVAAVLPWYVRNLALPVAAGGVLSLISIDGRPFHQAAVGCARFLCGPRQLAALRPAAQSGARWHPQDIVLLPDGSDGRVRHLLYRGPGSVTIAIERRLEANQTRRRRLLGRARPSRRELVLREIQGAPAASRLTIAVARGATLLFVSGDGSGS